MDLFFRLTKNSILHLCRTWPDSLKTNVVGELDTWKKHYWKVKDMPEELKKKSWKWVTGNSQELVQKNFSLEIPKNILKNVWRLLVILQNWKREIPWNWLQEILLMGLWKIPLNGQGELSLNGSQEIPRNGLWEIPQKISSPDQTPATVFIPEVSQWRILPWNFSRKSPISVYIFSGYFCERLLGISAVSWERFLGITADFPQNSYLGYVSWPQL